MVLGRGVRFAEVCCLANMTKTVLIAGASRGLGLELAKRYTASVLM